MERRVALWVSMACCLVHLWLLWGPAVLARADPVLVRPVPGEVLRGFDPPTSIGDAAHRGVDLRAGPGDVVVAASSGRVSHVGVIDGVPTVSITHDEATRLRTTYQPVRATVAVGDRVIAGQVIGRVVARDSISGASDSHEGLHWGLVRGDEYLDPLAWLGGGQTLVAPIRLLPDGATPRPVTPDPTSLDSGPLNSGLGGGPGMPWAPGAASSRAADGPVTSRFGMRFHPVLKTWRLHDGVDLGAACGTPARAVLPGRVVSVEHHVAYGIRVIVDHGGGVRSGYAHLSATQVVVGQTLASGQQLGRVGTTGWSTGCHLHLMAWHGGQVVDPSAWVK